jgi:hypothetical protein
MRTTVNIDDHLLAEAKAAASSSHRSLGSVVEDALRVFLTERMPSERSRAELSLPTGNVGALRPGIELEDKEQLAELLDDNEFSGADR